MEKMTKLEYQKVTKLNNSTSNVTAFTLQPLERGMGQTLGVALRRILLSNITSLALFAIKIEDVNHEFQVVDGCVEDVATIIMNLRKVKFQYNPEFVKDDEIIKVTLKADQPGEVTSRLLEVNNSSIEILNKSLEIAHLSANGKHKLNIELYLRPGRGFISNEENKKLLNNSSITTRMESKIKNGIFIATDSNFSPIEKVNYTVEELNSSSNKIEERLTFSFQTDGTVDPKSALQQACEILVGHFKLIGNVDEMKVNVFAEESEQTQETNDNDVDINSLNISVRSLNALKRIGKTKISQVAEMSLEELEQVKNLGRKSLDEIQQRLKEYGYELSKGEE